MANGGGFTPRQPIRRRNGNVNAPIAGRVGNYVAPVDTTGMDPEMQKLFQEPRPSPLAGGGAPDATKGGSSPFGGMFDKLLEPNLDKIKGQIAVKKSENARLQSNRTMKKLGW